MTSPKKIELDGHALVRYFDHETFSGERRVYCCGAANDRGSFSAYWPHTAYFCPVCGDLWGRAIFDYDFTYEPRISALWTVEQRRCVLHGDGQFLFSQSLEFASVDLLTRELLVLIEGAEHGNYSSNTSPDNAGDGS